MQILAAMQQVMGRMPGNEKRCALDPRVIEEIDCGDYVRRFLDYASEPGARVPAYLLIPKTAFAKNIPKLPAILALHQTHAAGQKVVVGLGNSPDDEYGVELVKRGFVVLAPPYALLANYQPDIRALGWQSGTLKSVWDNMRGIDLLSSLPFVRTNKGFGAIGHSLGGHNGVFTAAFDERLRVIVSSCGLDSFLDYHGGDAIHWRPERGWCQLRYMPELTNYSGRLREIPFDFPEIVATLAPRACLISAPLGDTNFRSTSVDEIAKSAWPVFGLYGASAQLEVRHPNCGHLFPANEREHAFQFLEENLR